MDIASIGLSIPMIMLLYTITIIRKERVKRERNFIYCKADIMENETLRDYIVSDDYKNHLGRLILILSIAIIIAIILIVVYDQRKIKLIIIISLLAVSIYLVHPIKDTYEMTKYKTVRDALILSLELELPSSSITTSKMFDSGFLKAFIQRTNKRIHTIDYDFFENTKFLKDKVKEFVGFLRPSLNYFITQDNQIVQEYDTEFIYKVLKSKEKLNLPELVEDVKYHDLFALEFFVWIILACINFDMVYKSGDEISSIVIIIVSIAIICTMIMYYILIAKDRL